MLRVFFLFLFTLLIASLARGADCPVDCQYDSETNTLVCSGNGEVTSGCLSAAERPYLVRNVTINPGITSIGERAFQHCTGLTNISIPSTVESIGAYAFSNCHSLTSINIPGPLTSIEENVFESCKALTNITIPSTVSSIGAYAFYSCYSLASINIPEKVESIGAFAFSYCSSLSTIIIPKGVSSIEEQTFCSTGLTSIKIHSGITSIGDTAFYSCNKLANVIIDHGIHSIGANAFGGCKSLSSIDLPSSVLSIGENAFRDSGLTYIRIPSAISSIQDYTFMDCKSLTGVFIPSTVKTIGQYAFYGCISLESLDIRSEGISIKLFAFYGCSSLNNVSFGSTVNSIGEKAFCDCNSLKSVTMTFSLVNSIGKNAFLNCSSLKSFIYHGSNANFQCNNDPFAGCDSLEFVCTHKSFAASGFCGVAFFKTDKADDCANYYNNITECYEIEVNSAKIPTVKKRSNATAWERQSNECYEYKCDKTPTIQKRPNSTEWEKQSNECYEYKCDETPTIQKRPNSTEWEKQSNECYLFTCNGSNYQASWERRENATEWEDQTNPCYKYVCDENNKQAIIQKKRDATELSNQCYEFICDDDESNTTIRKRTNWTEWEQLSNECYEYICDDYYAEAKIQKTTSATEWEKQSDACYEFICDESVGRVKKMRVNVSGCDNVGLTVGLTLGSLLVFAIAFIIIAVFICKRKREKSAGDFEDFSNDSTGIVVIKDGKSNNYRLIKTIGKGAFGTVWLAACDNDNTNFAVKEMSRGLERNQAEFEKEMSIMSQLDSPYIVRVYGSAVTNSSFFIVMEYVALGSLSTALNNYAFSSYMRCRFMLDVARGMEYLHNQGIIHRDLKPGNVLLSSLDPNGEAICKITDFGESRQGLEQTQTMTMTRGVGTPYYMAEEMLEGNNKYSRAVDVYSFGIMCVELWNERLPYSEANLPSIFAFIQYVTGGHRPQIRDDCPEPLAELFCHCWASNRQERPPFTAIVETLVPIVESVGKSMPMGVEHVKAREQVSKSTSGETQTNSNNTDTGFGSMNSGEIPLDVLNV